MAQSLLATIVLGSLSLERLAALGAGGDVLEELSDPAGESLGGGAVGDEGNVGLGVDNIRVAGNVLLVEVLLVGGRSVGGQGRSKAGVEGNGVGVVEGNGGDVVVVDGLLQVQNTLNLLVEFMGCIIVLAFTSLFQTQESQ